MDGEGGAGVPYVGLGHLGAHRLDERPHDVEGPVTDGHYIALDLPPSAVVCL